MLETQGTRLPLSDAQFGIWFAHQFDPTRRLFYFTFYADIAGLLDVQLLGTALRQAVAETETLNVRFIEDGGALYQVVEPMTDWSLTEFDFSTQPDPHAAALSWMRAEPSRPIDLSYDRLFNSALIKIAPDRYYWYCGVHHIAMDGFSIGLLVGRVCELYRALRRGEALPAPWFGRLRSLIEEEAATRNSEQYKRDRAYWAEQFADRPTLHALGSRPATGHEGRDGAFEMIRAIVRVPPSTAAGIRAIAKRLGSTLGRFAIAATGLYLCRVSNSSGTTLSLPFHRRLTRLAEQTPCTMANVLPVRLTLSPAMTLSEYCTHAFTQIEGALLHHSYRGERLRVELDPDHHEIGYFGPPVNVIRVDYRVDLDGVEAKLHLVSIPTLEDFNIGFEDQRIQNQFLLHVRGSSASRTMSELHEHAEGLLALLTELALADPGREIERIAGWC